MPHARPRVRRTPVVGGALALSFGLSQIARVVGFLPLVVAVVLLVVNGAALVWLSRVSRVGWLDEERALSQGLAASWLLLLVVGVHNFVHRPTSEAITQASPHTAAELAVYGAIGALSVAVLRTRRADPPIPITLVLLPIWVSASALWSASPAYALARGFEYVVLALIALATAAVARDSGLLLEEMVWSVLRWFVRLVLVLIGLGLALGPLFVAVGEENRGRFTWMGAHPGSSGLLLGAALLVVLSSPARRLRLTPGSRLLVGAVLVFAIVQNETRTTLGGIAIAMVLLLARWALDRPNGAAELTYLIGIGLVGLVLGGGAVMSFVLRGGSLEKLTSLNGRSDLWPIGIGALHGVGDWLLGLGFGASRVIFVEHARWAGSAHSSALGNLVNLGLIGLGTTVAILLRTGIDLWRSRAMSTTSFGTPLACLLIYVVAAAVTSENLAEPTFGTAVLYLCCSVAASLRAVPPMAVTRASRPVRT